MTQLSYDYNTPIAVEGLVANSRDAQFDTLTNQAVAQVTTIVITADDSQIYTVTIDGVISSFTSDASATIAEIAIGLQAAIEANTFVTAATASIDGSDQLILTGLATGVPFTESDTAAGSGDLVATLTTAAVGDIDFGRCVVQGGSDDLCALPQAAGDIVAGITPFEHVESVDGNLPADTNEVVRTQNYKANGTVNIMRRGVIWVIVEEAVTKGAAVYARHTPSGANVTRGLFRTDADTASALLVPTAVFKTAQATPGGFAQVEINLP